MLKISLNKKKFSKIDLLIFFLYFLNVAMSEISSIKRRKKMNRMQIFKHIQKIIKNLRQTIFDIFQFTDINLFGDNFKMNGPI